MYWSDIPLAVAMTVMERNELISNIKLKPVEEAGSSLFNIVDS
jgi:hypothetical protein